MVAGRAGRGQHGRVAQAPVNGGQMTQPAQPRVSASIRPARVAGSTSALVATPVFSISGTAADTTLAQPQAGASGPPSARVSTSSRGPGSPASPNRLNSAGPSRGSIPPFSAASRSQPRTWLHSAGCGLAHR